MKFRSLSSALLLLLLAGASCTSGDKEAGEPQETKVVYLSLDVITDGTTRADGDVISDPEGTTVDPETAIHSLTVYLLDNNGKVVAVGEADMSTKDYSEDKKSMTVTAGVRSNSALTQASYRVRAVANVNYVGQMMAARDLGSSDDYIHWTYTSSDFNSNMGLPSGKMPMSTISIANEGKVNIEEGKGALSNPHPSGQSITLTRMMAAIGYNPGWNENWYHITDNSYQVSNQNLKLEFLTMTPVNVASKGFLVQHSEVKQDVNYIVTPAQSTWFARLPQTKATSIEEAYANISSPKYSRLHSQYNVEKTICYVPENVPLLTDLTIGNATGIVLTAVLRDTEGTPDNLVKILNGTDGKEDLVYYDDGTFQSALYKESEVKKTEAPLGPEWHRVKWSDNPAGDNSVAGGYVVRYHRAIRHVNESLNDSGTDKDGAIDGIHNPMEYAVVRNHKYIVYVKKVHSLPHPFDPTVEPEDGKHDVDIEVSVQKEWNYNRTATPL